MNAAEAVRRHVAPGDRVLLGTGAGEASSLEAALVEDRDRLTPLTLMSGLQFGGYPFSVGIREGRWMYETWHVTSEIRDLVDDGRVGLHMVRGSLVPRLITRLRPDVFLTAVSPPGPDGTHSFGASVSYALPMATVVGRVIAEVNPSMPWVRGNTCLSADRFTALVDAEAPLPSYRAAPVDDDSLRIAHHVLGLLPDSPTVQIGLGSVPESVVGLLSQDPPDGLTLFGMGIDEMVGLLERIGRPGMFIGGELLGTERLYRYAHDQPTVLNFPMADVVSVAAVGRMPGFVSVIGALQVDSCGQVNSEVVGGRVVSGPGGGFDFVDGSWLSDGGVSIVALRSTAKGGSISTIVPELPTGAPVTVPRHSVRYVVTEFGVADLFGLNVWERKEALASIAHPSFRDELTPGESLRTR